MILMRLTERGHLPDIGRRDLRRTLTSSYRAMGEHWHKTFLPRHFTAAGARKYGYLPRKGESGSGWVGKFWGSYTGRKQRKHGHRLPLVWSGESRALARVRDVRATSRGVRIVIRANKLNFRPRGGRIRMRDELTTVTPDEATEVLAVGKRAVDQEIDAIRAFRQTTFY